MMHQVIKLPDQPAKRVAVDNGWCILRTSGGRTLPLASSLTEAGIEAWTPRRTFKRKRMGNCTKPDGSKPTIEVDGPVMPTFVFARAINLDRLVALSTDPSSQHPAFSVFSYLGKAPIVSDTSIEGFRQAERDEAAAIQAIRDADTRAEAEEIRIAALKSENARLKAMRKAEAERRKLLRAERREFDKGEYVRVEDHPAFAGMTGIVESSDGRTAFVDFGGSISMKIEAWRLVRNRVAGPAVLSDRGIAA